MLKRSGVDSALYVEFAWTLVERRQIWKLLEPGSFDIWRKTEVPIILGHLEVDTEVLDVCVEMIGFSKYREVSEIVVNNILAAMYCRS